MPLVIPHRYVKGWNGTPVQNRTPSHIFSDGRAIQICEDLPLLEALKRSYATDAYLVGYGGSPGPRLTKSALTSFLGDEASAPKLKVALVDVDSPGHSVPEPGWTEEVLEAVPEAFRPSLGWYRTPHGLRLVWKLSRPVSLFEADSFLKALHASLPFQTDEGTADWTRLQRLPRAAGIPALPYDFSALEAGTTLDWRPETPLVRFSPSALGEVLDTPRPSAAPKLTRTSLKKLLKADESLAEALLADRLHAPTGQRHATLLRAALTIAGAYASNDPAVPYEILSATTTRLGKSLDELWSICHWAAATQSGREAEAAEEAQDLWTVTAEAMGCSVGDAYKRLIIDAGAAQFVWDEEELRYSAPYSHKHQLLPAIDRHCPRLIGDWYDSFAAVLRDHSTVAREIVYSYDPAYDGYSPETETMYYRVCRQDPSLRPEFSADVDEWLRGIFAGPHLESVLDWLACVPNLAKPICGLYLEGPKSLGKSLLAMGLARLWSPSSTFVEYSQITANFNGPLLRSPLVYGDEKATDAQGRSDSADFRRLIGNSSIPVEEKYLPRATILGYPRLLITANNAHALQIQEDLDPADIEAIQLRIGHVKAPKNAADVLKSMARARGFESVRDMADPWIKQGVIARHVLALQKSRKVSPGDRFLVEGWASDWTQNLSTNIGSSTLVTSAIVQAVLSNRFFAGVRFFGGEVYVSNKFLARDWEELLPGERLPGHSGRLKALKALSEGEKRQLDLPGSGSRTQPTYWRIPAEKIAYVAQAEGLASREEILALAARVEEQVAAVSIRPETVLEF